MVTSLPDLVRVLLLESRSRTPSFGLLPSMGIITRPRQSANMAQRI